MKILLSLTLMLLFLQGCGSGEKKDATEVGEPEAKSTEDVSDIEQGDDAGEQETDEDSFGDELDLEEETAQTQEKKGDTTDAEETAEDEFGGATAQDDGSNEATAEESFEEVEPTIPSATNDSQLDQPIANDETFKQDQLNAKKKKNSLDRYRPTIFGLIKTARVGTSEMCRYYLRNGVNINGQNRAGETPLHAALRAKRYFNAKLFINENAKLDIKDNQGKTARDLIRESENQMLIDMLSTK